MQKVTRIFISLFIFLVLFSCKKNPPTKTETKYIASTSWVASIAELAGLDNLPTIAPVNLQHPPEYEIKPTDILQVAQSEYFICAGYEVMMKTITEATQIEPSKIVKIRTTNTIGVLQKDIEIISQKTGTQEIAQKRFAEFKKMIEESRERIKNNGIDKKNFYVNVNLEELATDLGLNIVGVFGPGPLSAQQISFVTENKIDFIIDNVHNPVAKPLLEVNPDSKLLIWRNFPEQQEKNAIYNLVKQNIEMLFE